jgi:hypothetical protein
LTASVAGSHRVDIAAPWLVRALVAAGQRDRARRLIATWPATIAGHRAATLLDLGSFALEIGDASEAERWLRLAVTPLPKHAEAHEKLGVSLLQQRVTKLVESLETARAVDPDAPARIRILRPPTRVQAESRMRDTKRGRPFDSIRPNRRERCSRRWASPAWTRSRPFAAERDSHQKR